MSLPVWSVVVAPAAAAVLCAAAPSAAAVVRLSALGSAATLAVVAVLGFGVATTGALAGPGLRLDALGIFLAAITALLSAAASAASRSFMAREAERNGLGINSWRAYFGLLHLFTASMLCVPISDNLGFLWIAVEATTLSSAFLVGFHGHRHSVEAAWKYVILCSVGIAFALFGTILLYYAGTTAGDGQGLEWSSFMAIAPRMDPRVVRLALLFAVLGYGTKAGLAPMHTWLPDAHSQAPGPVSALLSGVLLTTAFYALVRFHAIAAACLGGTFSSRLFIGFGLLSLGLAAPFILAAREFKRMLAYSSMEHIGLMALALGVGTPWAVYGMLLHLLCHALAKALAFMSAGLLLSSFGTRKIGKIRGAVAAAPEAGLPFFLAALALAGLPPFGLFVSEFIILSETFASGHPWAGLAALVFLASIFGGLVYHAARMSLGEPRLRPPRAPASAAGAAGLWDWAVPAACCAGLLVLLGVWIPAPLDAWLTGMSRIVLGGAHG